MRNGVKWALGVASCVLLAVVAVVFVYRSVKRDVWAVEREAMALAAASTILKHPESTIPFYGRESVTVVFGRTADGREAIAWVSPTVTHAVYADDGVSEAEIRRRVVERTPGASVERVIPGIYRGQYVWEALYRAPYNGETRIFYDYYRFEDGTYIETIRLKG